MKKGQTRPRTVKERISTSWGQGVGQGTRPKRNKCEAAAQKLARTVTAACDTTMPQQCPRRKIGDVNWWTEDIAHLKSKANLLC